MPHRDDQDAGVTARKSVQDVIAKAAWNFEREDHEVDPNIRAHALSIRVQEALTEARLAIVEAGQVCFDKDEAIRLMTLAAVAPGAEYLTCGICLQPLGETDTAPGMICRSCWESAFPAEPYPAVAPGAEDAR